MRLTLRAPPFHVVEGLAGWRFTARNPKYAIQVSHENLLAMNEASDSPRSYCVTLAGPDGVREITAGADQHIWNAAQEQGVQLPAICHQGFCLTCAGQLLAPGDFDSSDCEQYFPEDRAAGYILLCTSKARSDLRVRTHAADDIRRHRVAHRLPSPYS